MDKKELNDILAEFSIINCYLRIARDYCEAHEEYSPQICTVRPFLDFICHENNIIYNKLDEFEIKLNLSS